MSHGLRVRHSGFPINICTVLSMFLSRMSSSENREYSSLYSFSMLLPAAETNYHKHSSFKQHRCMILQFYRSEVWFRSHQSKIKVSAGLWSFPEAPEGVSLLIWTFGKIQFFGCYRTDFPFPCCLSAESCFYFHSLVCGLFLHFQSQQQPYEAVRVTCVKQRGQRNAKGPLVFVIKTLPDTGICSVFLELGWGKQKPTKN